MRADRLLSIILLLQVNRRLTARELAEKLEVSERTILRDMEALGMAGIPVVAERGAGGGWSLMEGYRTDLTGLSETEAQALFLTGPARVLADLRLDKAAEAALLKLLAGLPAVFRRGADSARRRIHVDVAGWRSPEDAVPLLPTIQEAVWQERKLGLRYQKGPGEEGTVERVVDPLGLVAKGSLWYLAAAVEGQVRCYRVSRVLDATILDEPATRPQDFDLAAWWEQSAADLKAAMPRYPATVRVHPDLLPRLRYALRFARIEAMGEPGEDGWTAVEIRFQFEEEAIEYVLSFGTRIEVVAPPELRERVIQRAKDVVAFNEARAPV
ncbi:MAG TPA: YafY family protein [Thermoanaerobaculia bacterium]|jgi:predicted DNA-binding transcriptional regulator YafY|nr:YafY family protein [Thermoanaerobaculia bacterium]